MKWLDVVKSPAFWLLGTAFGIFLNIVSNFLTPYVGRQWDTLMAGRKSKRRQKQIEELDTVILLCRNIHKRTHAKLDAVFSLLGLALCFGGVCLLWLYPIPTGSTVMTILKLSLQILPVPVLLVIFALFNLVLRKMSLTAEADKREDAIIRFLRTGGPVTQDEMAEFEEEYDFKRFGVTEKDITPASRYPIISK